ncbi:MAG: phosphoribosylglycinamide formyltransferase [Clostridiales bacterium]|nr:phosphoribosylglycinamide formyltransferase [Clostridiales bacterium]
MLAMIVLVSGRGSNLMSIQAAIEKGALDGRINAVISNKREAAALAFAKEKGLPAVWMNPKEEDGRMGYENRLFSEIEKIGSDCLVLAGYSFLLNWDVFRHYGKPILNIHPALLPAFPGMTAQRDALAYGVKYSGCTVHFVDGGMDSGPIIAQKPVPVMDLDDEERLSARILAEEHKLYPEVLTWLARGRIRRDGRIVRVLPDDAEEGGGRG